MTKQPEDLEKLISYIHGELPAEQCRLIEEQLLGDRDLCRTYLELAEEESILVKRAKSEEIAKALDDQVFGEEAEGGVEKSRVPRSVAFWAAIAASLVAVCTTIWGLNERGLRLSTRPIAKDHRQPQNRPPVSEVPKQQDDPDLAALLISDAGAVFRTGHAPAGFKFRRQTYILDQGVAYLRLVSGVDLVVQSPVEFSIADPLRVQLDHGSIRATVPEEAQGFLITTPSADVEDLGTEFGVTVDAETKTSEVHVFDGEVNIRDTGRGAIKMALREGQAAQLDAAGKVRRRSADSERFPSPQAVAFRRWRLWSEEFRKDPTLLCYYDFERDESAPDKLRNVAVSGVATDGTIDAAPWASGRWRAKKALWFDNDHHVVNLSIPGEYSALTIATWFKIDRFDTGCSVIFRSDDVQSAGAVQFFTSKRSSIVNGSVTGVEGSKPQVAKLGIPTGEWVHLATVYNAAAGTCRSYLNGELMMTRQIGGNTKMKIGDARIAATHEPFRDLNWQGLRGRMDEFAIWSRVLDTKELQALVRETRP